MKLVLPSDVQKRAMLLLQNWFCNQQDESMCSWTPEGSHVARGAGLANMPLMAQWPANCAELAWQELPAGSVQLLPGHVETPSLDRATHKYTCLNNT